MAPQRWTADTTLGQPRPTTDQDLKTCSNTVFDNLAAAWDYIERDAVLGVITASEHLRRARSQVDAALAELAERAEEVRRAREMRREWGM